MMKLAAAILAALALAAPAALAQETLQIISPHWQGIEDEFGPAFEAYYKAATGKSIDVVWRDMGGTSDDLRWIKSGFATNPETVDVDLFFGGGTDPYRQLKSLGLLATSDVPDETLASIPPDLNGVPLYDPDRQWFGTAISGFGIIYNKFLLSRLKIDAPDTWEDLADPRLFSWVGAGDPRHSGTVHMMYEIILQAYGWDRGWQVITALAANTRSLVQNSGDIPTGVAKGRIAAGTAIDFYAWTQVAQAGPDRVGFALPDGLTVVNPDSIAVLKGAPNPAAAQAFVRFVLSEEGQKLWYLKIGAPGGPKKYELFRMPVSTAVYEKFAALSPVAMNPFTSTHKAFHYDSALGTKRYEALNDLLGATVVDCHRELVSAWSAAVRSGKTAEILPALAAAACTEAELNALTEGALSDPVARNNQIGKWVTSAREKYKRLAK